MKFILNLLALSIATTFLANSAHATACTPKDVNGLAQMNCQNMNEAEFQVLLNINQQVCVNGQLKSASYKTQKELYPTGITKTNDKDVESYDEVYGGLKLVYDKIGTQVLPNASMMIPNTAYLTGKTTTTTVVILSNLGIQKDEHGLYFAGAYVRRDKKTGKVLKYADDLRCDITVPF